MGPFQRGKGIAGYVLSLHSPVEEHLEGGERVVPTTWTCGEAFDTLHNHSLVNLSYRSIKFNAIEIE